MYEFHVLCYVELFIYKFHLLEIFRNDDFLPAYLSFGLLAGLPESAINGMLLYYVPFLVSLDMLHLW